MFCKSLLRAAGALVFFNIGIPSTFAEEVCELKLRKAGADSATYDVVRGKKVVYKDLSADAGIEKLNLLEKEGYCQKKIEPGACRVDSNGKDLVLYRTHDSKDVLVSTYIDFAVGEELLGYGAENLSEDLALFEEAGFCGSLDTMDNCTIASPTGDGKEFSVSSGEKDLYVTSNVFHAAEVYLSLYAAKVCENKLQPKKCTIEPTGTGNVNIWRQDLQLASEVQLIASYKGRGATEILGALTEANFCLPQPKPTAACTIKAGEGGFRVFMNSAPISTISDIYGTLGALESVTSRWQFCLNRQKAQTCALQDAGENEEGIALFDFYWGEDKADASVTLTSLVGGGSIRGLYRENLCTTKVPAAKCVIKPVTGDPNLFRLSRKGRLIAEGAYESYDPDTGVTEHLKTLQAFGVCQK